MGDAVEGEEDVLNSNMVHVSAILAVLAIVYAFRGMIYRVVTDFITDHRGIFVVVFVLPLSLIWDVFFMVRAWIVFKFYSAPKLHEKRVEQVRKQVLKAVEDDPKGEIGVKLVTARGGWLSISPSMRTYKSHSKKIAINMFDILELNEKERYVHCEPMVNMGQLSRFLIPRNFTIPVLPEMDDLTCSGLFLGVGIECNSHKYGLFNDCVIEAEVVLANGEVVTCSKTENVDLFDALPWSYGTLGFLVSMKIRVISCKPYVRLEYHPCLSQLEGVEKFTKFSCADEPADFVEGLQYSLEKSVVMTATFCDAQEVEYNKLNSISLWYKLWFYKMVETHLDDEPGQIQYDYVPLRDYYHRHTKSIFWELSEIIPWGNNPVFRYLLGWAVPPSVAFLKLTQTPAIRRLYETQHVIQDMLVPISKMQQSLNVFHEQYEVYPLWLCAYRAYDYTTETIPHRSFLRQPGQLQSGKNFLELEKGDLSFEMYLDLGAYGVPQACKDKKPFDIVKNSRQVENFVEKVHGHQMLYATSYQTDDEFRTMFNHVHYDEMKSKYDPFRRFPQVFEKVCLKGMAAWEKSALDKKNE